MTLSVDRRQMLYICVDDDAYYTFFGLKQFFTDGVQAGKIDGYSVHDFEIWLFDVKRVLVSQKRVFVTDENDEIGSRVIWDCENDSYYTVSAFVEAVNRNNVSGLVDCSGCMNSEEDAFMVIEVDKF